MNYLQHFWTLKPIFMPILAFLLPLNLAVNYDPDFESESKCAYVITVMALLWLTEAIPIPVTALIPIFLFPLLGVQTAAEVSNSYIKDTTMLFLGGLIVAVALEESRLHIRISLCVMLIVGTQPILLMAGLMATTWFLSMWISNTAATSMMIPIIDAVLQNMEDVRKSALGELGVENEAYEKGSESSAPSTDISTLEINGDIYQASDMQLKEPPLTFCPSPIGDDYISKHFEGTTESNIDFYLHNTKSKNYKLSMNQNGRVKRSTSQNSETEKNSMNQNERVKRSTSQSSETENNSMNHNERVKRSTSQSSETENNSMNHNERVKRSTSQSSETEKISMDHNERVKRSTSQGSETEKISMDQSETDESNPERISGSKELRRFAKAFALSVAYGANIGGIATLTGTPPNLVLKQEADKLYNEYTGTESEISFAKWFGFGLPLSLFTAFFGWLWLVLVFIRCGCCRKTDAEQRKAINSTIRTHFKQLGRLTLREIQVLVIFLALVVLWLFRAPPNMTGWGNAGSLKKGYVSDSTPCILLGVLLFSLPAEIPKVFWLAKDEKPSYTPLLDWKSVCQKLPWGVIVLLGGGFAIADASEKSGMSEWVGNALIIFSKMDSWVMNMLICFIVAGVTEVTSNTATATLLMPILSELALQTGIHPLYLMMSATVACSFAFMLPVATPPNAIVFSSGYLTILEMALTGLPMNIIAVLCLTFGINTWGTAMFNLDTFPDIFNQTIETS